MMISQNLLLLTENKIIKSGIQFLSRDWIRHNLSKSYNFSLKQNQSYKFEFNFRFDKEDYYFFNININNFQDHFKGIYFNQEFSYQLFSLTNECEIRFNIIGSECFNCYYEIIIKEI